MPGDSVVGGKIEHGVSRESSRGRADGFVAVLEELRADGVDDQADFVEIILSSSESRFEHAMRCIGRNLAGLARNDAAGESGIEQADIGKGVGEHSNPHLPIDAAGHSGLRVPRRDCGCYRCSH